MPPPRSRIMVARPPAAQRVAGPGRVGGLRAEQLPLRFRLLLTALIFSAFLSGIKFVPGIGTNIGPFEILGVLLIPLFLLDPGHHERLHLSGLSKILLLITIWAALSQFSVRPENTRIGIIQTAILATLFLTVTSLHNIVRRYRITPERLLTLITMAVLIVGPWVLLSGISSAGDIQASGPFRNRAHVATYMLTSFWMVVIFLLLPAVRTRMRWMGYIAAASALYAIAVSGRRSVYLALFVGLAGLTFAFVLARRGKRLRMFVTACFAVVFIWLFYSYGSKLFPQARFFQQRVGSVATRVLAFVAPLDTAEAEDNFYLLQREGVMLAFRDKPLTGIGWGSFVRSSYSPTGHEVHSTPLRFLAELGLIGLLLYISLLGYLLLESLRLFLRMRGSPYSASYLALAITVPSLSISYIYNRHLTERTFWLFLAVFLCMKTFSEVAVPAVRRKTTAPGAAPTRDRRLPRTAAGSPAPSSRTRLGARRFARPLKRRGGHR